MDKTMGTLMSIMKVVRETPTKVQVTTEKIRITQEMKITRIPSQKKRSSQVPPLLRTAYTMRS